MLIPQHGRYSRDEWLTGPSTAETAPELADKGQKLALLDDLVFFAPFAPHFHPVLGRPSTPVECYLRLIFLKFRHWLGYETLCAEVSDSISWRRFCRIPLDATVPHPTTLQALDILAKAGDQWGQARTLTSIGSCLADLGRHEEAIERLTQALRIRREITDQRGQAETLDQLAVVLLQTEAPVKARHAWRAALAIFEQLGDPQAETVRTRLRALAGAGQTHCSATKFP